MPAYHTKPIGKILTTNKYYFLLFLGSVLLLYT